MLPFVASTILALAWLAAAQVDECTTYPNWTITDFQSQSSDSVGNSGRASFTLTNDLTGASDKLSCPLQANYRCEIAGTPSDKNLDVTFEVRDGFLTVTLDEQLDCPDKTSPFHVIANQDLELNCTSSATIGGQFRCTLEEATVQGVGVELAPGR